MRGTRKCKTQNMEDQLTALTQHESFIPFLINASRVETKKKNLCTYLMVIEVLLGVEYGEIWSTKSFEVFSVEEFSLAANEVSQ